MTDYLARLKARSGQKHLLDAPPKPTKPGSVSFGGGRGGHFSQATSGAASVPSQPSSAITAPTNTVPTDAGQHSTERWTDAHEERSAVIEFDGSVPRAWAQGFARLDPMRPPIDVSKRRWLRFIDDCGGFLDAGWVGRAAALGWGPLDLFGCNKERPFARIDHAGLLWLVNGGAIVELHRDRAIIKTQGGAFQTYRRRPVEVGHVVLVWELRP